MNDLALIGVSVLLFVSVLVSKISDRFGVPTLLLFLVLGMLAGSDGPGGLYFDDPALAQSVGVIALVLILFSGGFDTDWRQIRRVWREGALLSTVGVGLTAATVGVAAASILGLSLLEGLLLGAIVSSTDAAAVFSVLRARGIGLRGRLKPLLELESGSNDPMAIFLTIGLIALIQEPTLSPLSLITLFVRQMVLGGAIGYAMGYVILWLVNRLKLGYEGLYPVLTLSLVLLTFGLTDLVEGSGFLAVYVAGIVLGQHDVIHKRSLMRFHDGLAWIMQIAMFLTLGLLVFPSRLVPIIGAGLLVAASLMFIARPLSVFFGLWPGGLSAREKLFVSWVGLRGAAPIILATFPLLAGLEQADLIFNVVFFVVLTSVLLQGTTIPLVARWLAVEAPIAPRRIYPLEFTRVGGFRSELKEVPIPEGSMAVGKAIVDLGLPADFLVVLIARDNDFVVPSGGAILQGGDTLLVLADREALADVAARFGVFEATV